ncbi:MAG: hypothetical protein AABY73_06690 [Pseudomonadota bacterium]
MHKSVHLSGLLALLIAATSGAWAQEAKTPVKEQANTKTQQQEPIYGSQLMTQKERNAHRAKMRAAKTDQEREQIRLEHHKLMQARAKERGVTLPDEPPASGKGMGPGPGMGGGMGPGSGMGGGKGGGR